MITISIVTAAAALSSVFGVGLVIGLRLDSRAWQKLQRDLDELWDAHRKLEDLRQQNEKLKQERERLRRHGIEYN